MHSPVFEAGLQVPAKAVLIGVDWGTSNLRVMRIGCDGAILDLRVDQRGAAGLAAADFNGVLHEVAADWLDETDRVLVCGMAGARGKWRETGYCSCPVGLTELLPIELADAKAKVAIVPGVASFRGSILVDVMRGEETQVFGVPEDHLPSVVVLPGTHSKWINLSDGQIRDFRTFITGDLFHAIRTCTVLGEAMGDPGQSLAAFEDGVQQGLSDRALTAALFGVRTKRLAGLLSESSAADYLSGLVIGAEIFAQEHLRDKPVTLVGPPALNGFYSRALAMAGFEEVNAIDANTATARGLWRISEAHRS